MDIGFGSVNRTGYSGVNKLEVNNCIRRFTHSNVKINKRKNIVTDKIIQ